MKTSTRTFQIPDRSGSAISVRIHEDVNIQAENLHLETWGASLVLARRLHAITIPDLTNPVPTHSQPQTSSLGDQSGPILELGSGTGLVGLSAAAILKTDVMLTDLAPIVPSLEKNIELNKKLLSVSAGSASSGILDWRDPSAITLYSQHQNHQRRVLSAESNKASVILAADTIYDPTHPEMLVKVIKTWLKAGPDSRVLIAYPVRIAYLEEIREFWERMEDTGMRMVEEGKEELPKKEWDDETLIEWCVWKWKE